MTIASDPALLHEPGQAFSAEYLRDGRLRYEAEDGWFVVDNGEYFNNRPLYCLANTEGAVLTGDRPFARLLARPYQHGALAWGVARDENARWLHEFSEIRYQYRCGRSRWTCRDDALPDLAITIDVVPMRENAGFAARVEATGARTGDRLVWSFGGASEESIDPRWAWDPIMRGNPDIARSGDPRRDRLGMAIVPDLSLGNSVVVDARGFRVGARDATRIAQGAFGTGDAFRVGVELRVGDATVASDPLALLRSAPAGRPLAVGAIPLDPDAPLHFAVRTVAADEDVVLDPEAEFAAASRALAAIERVRSTSPDPRLDAAVASIAHAVNANCEADPAIFRHGAMAFNQRFIGWRVICGATAWGWHDRVLENARYSIGLQRTEAGTRTAASPDPDALGTHEGIESRRCGLGWLDDGNPLHQVQSQFFDQSIADWRATADREMERVLRPALELHCEWARECFDPDDDGLYESYANTLPTDSVWYSGGGSVEESMYALVAHRALADMAQRAGEPEVEERHRARVTKIATAMREKLWLPERGHFGAFVEQGGHRRVHPDAWNLSAFMPIDAGLTTPLEAIQSLYYTEWALERIRLPFGGELAQQSNWVPWVWSTRDIFGGDVAALALAHFQTGLGDAGYELLRGLVHENAYAGAVPGGFGHIGAGTDFGDSAHMFARTVVEGLYGYVPDYPNGRVLLRPAFPSTWSEAAIETPDFSLTFRRNRSADVYRVVVAAPARVTLRVPVRARRIVRVSVDGRAVDPRIEAGWGCTQLGVDLDAVDAGATVEVRIEVEDRVPHLERIDLAGRVGDAFRWAPDSSGPVAWTDPDGILTSPDGSATELTGRLSGPSGHHLVLARTMAGDLPRFQVYSVALADPDEEDARRATTPLAPGAAPAWEHVDLAAVLNGDIREIFRQQYVSPRPATCSLRVGTDGYSAWTFPHWGWAPPEIELDAVDALRDAAGRIVTPYGVPFEFGTPERNVSFTSLWDNWPSSTTVPVGAAAGTAWLLVAGSTFPMQTGIANAVLRFAYVDGAEETLELVPPHNFWMLSTWGGRDYDLDHDAFAIPGGPPPQVRLGRECRAMVLSRSLRAGVELESVTLETLSEEVVVGLLALTLEHPPG